MTMQKTFDAAEAEARIAALWEEQACFRAGANAKPGGESFCIVIPPPNVTGSLHIGHALNNTLQDILIRWRRMKGDDVLWQPGQDHAGIATQMVVERKLAEDGNESRREMGREKFLEKVWAWKEESGGTIIGQLKRLGASCDWSRNRFTMGDGLSRAVLRVFVQLYKEGLIYRDKRLVNWDPQFETAISDLEVEQVEVRPSKTGGKLWSFRYPLEGGVAYQHPITRETVEVKGEDGPETVERVRDWREEDGDPTEFETRDYLVVATTRPETMLGDTGVAVNPRDPRFKDLIGRNVMLPLVNRAIPIVADDYADPEKGSGAVKITPAHDFNDFQVGKRTGLRVINIMGPRAEIRLEGNAEFLQDADPNPDAMALEGLDRYDARLKIISLFEEKGLLHGIADEPHQVPHGDRSKVAIEPYLTDQWFVDAAVLAKPALEAVKDGRTTFAPKNWEKTYFQWLENIEPWCISRLLWWGHQIPVWYDEDGNAYCEETEEEAVKAAGGKQLVRDEDVRDTWFSSALWPFSTLGWPDATDELKRYYKTDVLITGNDIIFFWVARMMMAGMHFMRDETGAPEVPFHTVYINSIVRDEKGKKMSKSVGNVIDPLELIDDYGADAVRLTLAALDAQQRRHINLSKNAVEGYRNFGTKLWNATRLLEMRGCARVADFDPKSPQQTVNKWIVGETARLRETLDDALTGYRFNDYALALYAHVWNVFCDWYLEFAKPLLEGDDAAAKTETQATAAWALDQILLMIHPVTPFITEELWALTAGDGGRSKLLVHGDWPEYTAAELADVDADAEMGWIVKLIEAIRSVRSEMNVPPSAQIQLALTGASETALARMSRNEALVLRLARLESWNAAEEAPAGSITLAVEEATVNLPLADIIDVSAEKGRVEKSRGKIEKEGKGVEAKLGNANFTSKAPAEVIEEQKERLETAKAEADRLKAALARVAEMG
ncbi:MAG: valine--tRNA ligase [Neomegalonema sp.]